MESEPENLEAKLISLINQLQNEFGIFERLIYKNKNQHRRCSYFQYLLKVRRDLKLLESANLREILSSCFQVISGKRTKQKVHLLESLKRRKIEPGKFTFLEHLLGVARLLSQMVEPMLKAAGEISVMLGRTFFMGFSVTVLALLARIRVLVQQILLDVVSVFNSVSSLAQHKQSVKINQGSLEVFREVFPTKQEFVVLECVWRSDKFVLLEKTQNAHNPSNDVNLEEQASSKASSSVRYLTIESFLGEDETPSKGEKEDPKNEKDFTSLILPSQSNKYNDTKTSENCHELQEPDEKTPQKSSAPSPQKSGTNSRKVAFLAIKNPVPSFSNVAINHVKESESNSGKKEDSFFSLFAAESSKKSLF